MQILHKLPARLPVELHGTPHDKNLAAVFPKSGKKGEKGKEEGVCHSGVNDGRLLCCRLTRSKTPKVWITFRLIFLQDPPDCWSDVRAQATQCAHESTKPQSGSRVIPESHIGKQGRRKIGWERLLHVVCFYL